MASSGAKASTVRIDDELKAQAVELLDGMGMSFNGYLSLAVHQLVNQQRIPFEILPAEKIPTEETRRAMVTAEAKELGLIPDDFQSFTNADELAATLEE